MAKGDSVGGRGTPLPATSHKPLPTGVSGGSVKPLPGKTPTGSTSNPKPVKGGSTS